MCIMPYNYVLLAISLICVHISFLKPCLLIIQYYVIYLKFKMALVQE